MRLAFFIARRYLLSKRGTSTNAINVLSLISMLGITVGTLALLTILSVFNGFEDLILSMYNSFNPDMKIEVVEGKTFVPSDEMLHKIEALPEVITISQVVEENALLKYGDQEIIGTIKGVDEAYTKVTGIDSAIVDGSYVLENSGVSYAVLGAGLGIGLGINFDNPFNPVQIYTPKRGNKTILNPERAFNKRAVYPAGIFSVQQDFDVKYIFVSLDFARSLLDYDREVSALELDVSADASISETQEQIAAIIGPDFRIRNRLQQDEELYRVLNSEKWIIFFVLTLVLMIAAFNMIGSLSMLVINKKPDIQILKTMGATKTLVRRVFLLEGLMQTFIGYLIGISIATALCLAQQEYGFVEMAGSFVIDAYPVSLRAFDYAALFFTVMGIGLLASWFPAYRAAQQSGIIHESG